MTYVIHEIAVIRRGEWISLRRNEVSAVVQVPSAFRAMESGGDYPPIRSGGGSLHGTQRGMMALMNVDYVVTAEICEGGSGDEPFNLAKHVTIFSRRVVQGKCHSRPCLGMREFDAVVLPVSEDISPCDWTEPLGLVLYDVFDPKLRVGRPRKDSAPVSRTFFEARVVGGRMECHPDNVTLVSVPGPSPMLAG